MYPEGELTRLAGHKAALRRSIGRSRAQCATAAARVVQPFAWLDRALALWRRLSPLTQIAAVPLGVFLQRQFFPRRKLLGSLLRWGPLACGVGRALGAAFTARRPPAARAEETHRTTL